MKYGFVYLWYDRKHKRYYIGSHWGDVDDGYICSSPWMKNAYKRRPTDFRRRILETKIKTRVEQYNHEQKWLDLIKPEEVKIRYYNLNLKIHDHWCQYDDKILSIGQKISKTRSGKNFIGGKWPEESKLRFRKPKSEQHKANMRKPKAKVACPICCQVGGVSQMKRWHFNNCKELNIDEGEYHGRS